MKIEKMSPALKFLVLLFVSMIGSFDYLPYFSMSLIFIGLCITGIYSEISILEILTSIKAFIFITISYTFFMILVRLISGQDLAVISILGLSLRMILISFYSALFIKTTDSIEFMLCLIKYYKMPIRIGFAFMTAYRFLPSFKDELLQIVHAHRIRGYEASGNPIKKIWDTKRYLIPLLAGAIRKGIRLSIAMETRAFGKYEKRTYYRNITVEKNHILYAGIFCLAIIILIIVLTNNGLTNFRLIYS